MKILPYANAPKAVYFQKSCVCKNSIFCHINQSPSGPFEIPKRYKLKPPNEQATTNYHHRQIHLTQHRPKSDKGKKENAKNCQF